MPRVVHFEIHADDPQRAIAFYSKLFGWEFNSWGGPMEYYLIKTGPEESRGIDGGMIRRQVRLHHRCARGR
jgi:predicted enzyme related to lactoylglutathione lyase